MDAPSEPIRCLDGQAHDGVADVRCIEIAEDVLSVVKLQTDHFIPWANWRTSSWVVVVDDINHDMEESSAQVALLAHLIT